VSELTNRIKRLADLAAQLPPDTVPQAEIAARFDPTQYSYAKPVRDALDSLLAQLKNFQSQIDEVDFDSAPSTVRGEFLAHVDEVESVINQTLNGIKKQEGNVVQPRPNPDSFRNWATQITQAEGALFKLFQVFRRAPQISADQLNQAVNRAYAERQKLEKQTEEASRAGEKVAVSVLSEENIAELDKAIKSHEHSADNWLRIFVGACAIMLIILGWLVATNSLPANASVAQAIVHLFGKVLLVSFGLGLCVFSGRIYQTHAHNVIVNRQRRIASISFLQLYRAIEPGDQAGRQELIKQAAQAIFAQTSTGFLHKSGNEFAPFAPFIAEVVRSARIAK